MTAETLDALKSGYTIAVIVASVLAAAITWLSTRGVRKRMSEAYQGALEKIETANAQTVEVLNKTIAAHERFQEQQRMAFEHQIDELRREKESLLAQQKSDFEGRLRDLFKEKETYKEASHANGNRANALALEVETLKTRPDLSVLLESERQLRAEMNTQNEAKMSVLTEMRTAMEKISDNIEHLNTRMDEEMGEYRKQLDEKANLCLQTAKAMEALVTRFETAGILS
jgi:uncharacterized coiled-coil protein SlyX